MAESVQVKLDPEYTPLVEAIRAEKVKRLESGTSNKDIVSDAVKMMYAKYVKAGK